MYRKFKESTLRSKSKDALINHIEECYTAYDNALKRWNKSTDGYAAMYADKKEKNESLTKENESLIKENESLKEQIAKLKSELDQRKVMGRKPKYTEETVQRVLKLRKEGKVTREIAPIVNLSFNTVARIIKKYDTK